MSYFSPFNSKRDLGNYCKNCNTSTPPHILHASDSWMFKRSNGNQTVGSHSQQWT